MPRLEGFWTRNANPALVFVCRLGYQELNIGIACMVNHGQALFCTDAFFSLILSGPSASACEKHINGHQNSSDTQGEAVQK
jgi:hypothetical protein